jgi:AcrR family transcriptional regulator
MLSELKRPDPSSRTVKPRARDRQATEDALVAAASELFSRQGYEGTTTRNIAEHAGCSEVLIQRYFNGKEGLLIAVLRRLDNDSVLAFLRRPLCNSILEEARAMFAFALEMLEKRSHQLRIVHSRVLIDPSFKADFNRISLHGRFSTEMNVRLGRYREAGLLSPDLDIASMAEMLMTLCFGLGFTNRAFLDTDPNSQQRFAEHFAEMFARAVAPRNGAGPPSSA